MTLVSLALVVLATLAGALAGPARAAGVGGAIVTDEPARGAAGRSCQPRGTRLLAASAAARLYESTTELFACSTRTRRVIDFGLRPGAETYSSASGGGLTTAKLAGDYVAYSEVASRAGLDWEVRVVAIAVDTGRVRHRWKKFVDDPSGQTGVPTVLDVVVRPTGGVAWLFDTYPHCSAPTKAGSRRRTCTPTSTSPLTPHTRSREWVVERADARGTAVAGTGPSTTADPGPRRLKLHGKHLSWATSSGRRSTDLR